MRKMLTILAVAGAIGCGGASTGPSSTLTADKINGVWDFSFTSPVACGLLRNAVVPASIQFEGNAEIGNTVTGWTNDPSGTPDRWPLIGNINFPTRATELRFWTVPLQSGFDVTGTMSTDGKSFSGTAIDPIPGYTPYASLGPCSYGVTGQRRVNQ